MTQVGHTLTGVAIGVLSLPKKTTVRWKIVYFIVFMVFPNIPDIRIKYWGHHRYNISHSIFTNLFLIVVLVILFAILKPLHRHIRTYRVVIGGVFAWLSHLLLDSFYNHGNGIAIYWPFSQARLVLPIPWFSVVPHSPPPFTPEILRIYGIEFLAYFPLLIIAIMIKMYCIHHPLKTTA